jgi:hypothetical protein
MTSAESSFFVALATFILLLVTGGVIAMLMRPKIRLKRERRRLNALSTSAIAEEALRNARAAGISDHFSNADLFTHRGSWDRLSLLAALDALYKQLDAEDRSTGEAGRDGWLFSYYDTGLALIREVLAEQK